MPTFTIAEARAMASRVRSAASTTTMSKSATQVLNEVVRTQTTARTYDIFLSHSSKDAEIILGVKGLLEALGHSVYVDWIEDVQLDRTKVTSATADTLRNRMGVCKSLFFACTDNCTTSKWMPWECGYFDGKKGKSAVLPVLDAPTSDFRGQEYLGLYPYVLPNPPKGETKKILWVHRAPDVYVPFTSWLAGHEPKKH